MSPLGKSAPSSVVGLDIGSELIKIAEAKLVKDGIQISGLGVFPTPPGVIDNSIVVDPQALGTAIKQMLRESGIKTKHVVSSITGQSSVVVRIIEVPKMTPGELAETMKWEVERHVPFSPTDIQMDFAPIEKPTTPPDAQNMEVLLAVAQQEAIDAHVKTIFAAGLEPVAIDVQPLAVSRPLIDLSTNGSQPYVVGIVNIGATTTDVGVFEGGLLAFPGPPLPIAGVNFTRAISEALGVSLEEAEMLKKEYAEVDMSMFQSNNTGDTMYDLGVQAPAPASDPVMEPASYDTYVPQADSDYSPFDFGTAEPASAPSQPEEPKLDISGEDVFDLGGSQETPQFTPSFDLDEPEPAQQPAAAGNAFDFDLEDTPAAQEQVPATEFDQVQEPMPMDMQNDFATPAPLPMVAQTGSAPGNDMRSNVINAIMPVLMELATEIRRSIDYYSSRYQNRPEQIFLCGGTARMRNLDQFLANELGIPVVIADPMTNLTVNCPKYTPQYLREVSPLFPVSIGLAIREMLE